MSEYEDEHRHREEESLAQFFLEHQRESVEIPVFAFLA